MQVQLLAVALWVVCCYSDIVQAKIAEPQGLYAVTSEALGSLLANLGAPSTHNGAPDPKITTDFPINTEALHVTTKVDVSPRAEDFEGNSRLSDKMTIHQASLIKDNGEHGDESDWPVLVVWGGNQTGEVSKVELTWADLTPVQAQAKCGCNNGIIPRQAVLAITAILGAAIWSWKIGTQSGVRCCGLLLFLMMFLQRATI